MTTKLLALASLALASAASAAPTPVDTPTPPPAPPAPHAMRAPDRCLASGEVLFEVDHRIDLTMNAAGARTSEMVLYASGAWTFTSHDGSGKLARTASGCLNERALHTIRADLARASWTTKTAEATCAAISADYVEYRSRGKLVWTARMCQLPYLDETSAKSLAEIEKILDDASAPHTPPCCKK